MKEVAIRDPGSYVRTHQRREILSSFFKWLRAVNDDFRIVIQVAILVRWPLTLHQVARRNPLQPRCMIWLQAEDASEYCVGHRVDGAVVVLLLTVYRRQLKRDIGPSVQIAGE